jgi:hypothetical protein
MSVREGHSKNFGPKLQSGYKLYMQNLHSFMPPRRKKTRRGGFWAWGAEAPGGRDQAMKTAMNASMKISTPPANGKTIGIIGTMASMASTSSAGLPWSEEE